jgi:hypothetical protein
MSARLDKKVQPAEMSLCFNVVAVLQLLVTPSWGTGCSRPRYRYSRSLLRRHSLGDEEANMRPWVGESRISARGQVF